MSFASVPNARGVINALAQHVAKRRLERMRAVLQHRVHDTVAVLENVADAGNLHACLRTADALGIATVHVIQAWGDAARSSAATPSPGRADSGAAKWLNIVTHANVRACIDALRRDDYRIIVTDLSADALPLERCVASETRAGRDARFRQRVALAVGNEHRGVSQALRRAADARFFIPQCGFVQSLNVSVAFALSMHAFLARGTGVRAHPRPLSCDIDSDADDGGDGAAVALSDAQRMPPLAQPASSGSKDAASWLVACDTPSDASGGGVVAEPLPLAARESVAARWLILSVAHAERLLTRAGVRPPDY